jgi:hypothetical protein
VTRKFKLSAGIALVSLSALVVPAAASADDTTPPPAQDAQECVQAAKDAIQQLKDAVTNGGDVQAAVEAVRANVKSKCANRLAARLRHQHRLLWAARIFRLAARQLDTNVDVFSHVLDNVSGNYQDDIAQALQAAIEARQHSLDVLQGLLDNLPTGSVPGFTHSIASIPSTDANNVQTLIDSLENGDVSPSAQDEVQAALDELSQAVSDYFDHLRSLVDQVPAELKPYVNRALDEAEAQLNDLIGVLSDLLSTDPQTGGFWDFPFPWHHPVPGGDGSSWFGSLGGMLGMFDGLVPGGGFGGFGH